MLTSATLTTRFISSTRTRSGTLRHWAVGRLAILSPSNDPTANCKCSSAAPKRRATRQRLGVLTEKSSCSIGRAKLEPSGTDGRPWEPKTRNTRHARIVRCDIDFAGEFAFDFADRLVDTPGGAMTITAQAPLPHRRRGASSPNQRAYKLPTHTAIGSHAPTTRTSGNGTMNLPL
jgi:hypothetical protein